MLDITASNNNREPDYQTVSKIFPNIEFFDVDINEEEDLSELFIEDGVPTLYYIKGKNFKELPYPQQGFDKDLNFLSLFNSLLFHRSLLFPFH